MPDPPDQHHASPAPAVALDARAAARLLATLNAREEVGSGRAPRIEGYTIDDTLGEGAGGIVYRARRDGSEHPVALKVLHARLGRGVAAQRAWRELDILSQLRLPALPRLLDHGTVDGHLYLATELIEGDDLATHCDGHRLDPRQRAGLLAEIADAVHSLHEHGVIHRDLKPSNILIDATGRPTLLDLGIATLSDRAGDEVGDGVTVDGAAVGTPAFMAPEQARGECAAISTRSDVYALGAIGYMLLTGQPPHGRPDTTDSVHAALRRIGAEPPQDPRAIDSTLSRPLAAILLKAVDVEPSRRYTSAAALAADLRRWLDGLPTEAGGPSMAQRVGRWVARHPLAMTATVAVLLVATSVTTATFVHWRYNREPAFLEVDTTGRPAVVLRARSGRELHRWTATREEARVTTKMLLDGRATDGRRRVALLGFDRWDDHLSGRIAMFDPRRPRAPIWMTERDAAALDMPPPISRQGQHGPFKAHLHAVADIFSDQPSPQFVVAICNGDFSATCVRIIGWDGITLHEFWHDGVLGGARWLPDQGVLLLAAVNSEGTPQQRVDARIGLHNIPVVFAVRPERGAIHNEWIRFEGGGGTLEPLWYRAIGDAESFARFPCDPRIDFHIDGANTGSGRTVLVIVFPCTGDAVREASVYLSLDPLTGESEFIDICDGYVAVLKESPDRLPDPAALRLGPVPAAVPWPTR